MSKFLKPTSLPSAVILGFTVVLATRVVAADVPQTLVNSAPSDLKPTDSTAQSQASPAQRYGCITGYGDRPEGGGEANRTYRGNQSVSRYEFAAALNACLNQVQPLINSNTAGLATQADLAVPKRQLETLKSELERLRMRVDRLEGDSKQ